MDKEVNLLTKFNSRLIVPIQKDIGMSNIHTLEDNYWKAKNSWKKPIHIIGTNTN